MYAVKIDYNHGLLSSTRTYIWSDTKPNAPLAYPIFLYLTHLPVKFDGRLPDILKMAHVLE